ncbi:sodium:alanine symporter [Clostridium botulinum]|uniref:Sodium:alanine symporter n=2 Tax=Clostridium botulinum TaxID=1491 RepID=A0AA44BQB0_CLOBO|nr:sodium:alanine symporter [Clostridium botulinum]KEI83982.1 sodium:alanine symporter [Clostridium botulinum B2 433]NCI20711.1 sodium:alanine symporter [Clostridium botulinum]NCI35419.1 sodium:alanine symporter [Clostridium botulinum]NCI74549.1 sodium:alanine symporter [Clostridium botulinum]NFI09622.1 sodium:alanine symporter [Clostridium botulinum]
MNKLQIAQNLYLAINIMTLVYFIIISLCLLWDEEPIYNDFLKHIKNHGLKVWHILLGIILPVFFIYPIFIKFLLVIGYKVYKKVYKFLYGILNFTIYKKKEDK